jgi:hypothetical protein
MHVSRPDGTAREIQAVETGTWAKVGSGAKGGMVQVIITSLEAIDVNLSFYLNPSEAAPATLLVRCFEIDFLYHSRGNGKALFISMCHTQLEQFYVASASTSSV